jgi:ubiquitin C-terminal hydrolase
MSEQTNKNYDNYKNKGLSGLANLGNTCFINSCMQILSHTYELNELLNNEIVLKKIQVKYDSATLVEWNALRKMLWDTNCIVSPNKFIKTIQAIAQMKSIYNFAGFEQNDVSEFILFLIDCFHNSLAREIKMHISGTPENETDQLAIKCFNMIQQMYTKEYSEIWNIFYAVHVSEIICTDTGKVIRQNPEPYFMIDLPIPSGNTNPTLIDCLNLYIEGEELKNENAWLNDETKELMNIRKKISLLLILKYLVFSFFNNLSKIIKKSLPVK